MNRSKPAEPRWIKARFQSACGSCKAPIFESDDILWSKDDKGSKVFCSDCGMIQIGSGGSGSQEGKQR